jgi:outer membrane protein insertion porin family
MQVTDRVLPLLTRCAGVAVALLAWGLAAWAQVAAPSATARPIVSDVIILGNRLVPTEQIRARLRTRVGAEYDQAQAEQDVRDLYNTRQFINTRLDLRDDGTGRVKVYFLVRDLPDKVQKVTFQGAKHLKEEELNSLSEVSVGQALNPSLNWSACRKIVARYNEMGRPFATCTLLKGGEMGDTEVIFNITEGPKVAVRGIHFTGNSFVTSGRLATQIHSSSQWFRTFGGQYNPAIADADVGELIKYYRSFGFQDVQVTRETRWLSAGEVLLVFHIQEGVRYKIENVPDVAGQVKTVPAEQLAALSGVRPGSYFSEPTVKGDVERIKDYLGYMGQQARVEPVVVWSKDVPGVCNVMYQVQEEPQAARVGNIIIMGNERTRQNVILRQVPLYPGQILTYPGMRIAEGNLARLGIFKTTQDVHPTVQVAPGQENNGNIYKDILVEVQEDNTGSLMFGLGVNSSTGLTGNVVLNERNFDLFNPPTSIEDILNGRAWRGAGQELRLEAMPGTVFQRYMATFREPFLFDTNFSLLLSGYYNMRYYNEYTEDRAGGRTTIGRKLTPLWNVSTGLRIENVGVHNVSPFAPVDYQSVVGNNLLVGGRVGVQRDSRDSFMRPTSGGLLDINFEEVTGSYTFPLFNVDMSRYFTIYQRADGSGRHVLALHSQLGLAGSNTPVFERYFAGGFQTIRGFQFRGVGPDINGFKVGGDFLWLNSAEYQIPVKANDQIYFVTFVDSGTVSPRINQFQDYVVAAGFGVRFVVPMLGPVPIALDLGFPIFKASHDNTQIFQFWMGFFR